MDGHENGDKVTLSDHSVEVGQVPLKSGDEGHTSDKSSDDVGYTRPSLGLGFPLPLMDGVETLMRKARAKRYTETVAFTGKESMTEEKIPGYAEIRARYEEIFRDVPLAMGKTVSKQERQTDGRLKDTTSLVYGEIELDSFAIILHKIKTNYGLPGRGSSGDAGTMQQPGGIMVDIGSGTGKVLMRLSTANDQLLPWDKSFKGESDTDLEFFNGNALSFSAWDWSEAELVFANSTCFSSESMQRLASCCEKLSPGAIAVTFTKNLPTPEFNVLECEMYKMSWGGATVYIQQRR